MHRRPTIRVAGCVGPALPVLKYISTFRSGDARGEAAGWVAGWSVASRPSLPAARLVGRLSKADLIRQWSSRGAKKHEY